MKVVDHMIRKGKFEPDQRSRYGKALKGVASAMPRGPYVASRTQRQKIRSFVSYLVGKWINCTKFRDGVPQIDEEAQLEVAVVKAITWRYVIEGETLLALQQYQVRLIEEVFELLQSASLKSVKKKAVGDKVRFPPNFKDLLSAAPDAPGRTRVIIDILATMSEDQVASIHKSSSEVDWTLA